VSILLKTINREGKKDPKLEQHKGNRLGEEPKAEEQTGMTRRPYQDRLQGKTSDERLLAEGESGEVSQAHKG